MSSNIVERSLQNSSSQKAKEWFMHFHREPHFHSINCTMWSFLCGWCNSWKAGETQMFQMMKPWKPCFLITCPIISETCRKAKYTSLNTSKIYFSPQNSVLYTFWTVTLKYLISPFNCLQVILQKTKSVGSTECPRYCITGHGNTGHPAWGCTHLLQEASHCQRKGPAQHHWPCVWVPSSTIHTPPSLAHASLLLFCSSALEYYPPAFLWTVSQALRMQTLI